MANIGKPKRIIEIPVPAPAPSPEQPAEKPKEPAVPA